MWRVNHMIIKNKNAGRVQIWSWDLTCLFAASTSTLERWRVSTMWAAISDAREEAVRLELSQCVCVHIHLWITDFTEQGESLRVHSSCPLSVLGGCTWNYCVVRFLLRCEPWLTLCPLSVSSPCKVSHSEGQGKACWAMDFGAWVSLPFSPRPRSGLCSFPASEQEFRRMIGFCLTHHCGRAVPGQRGGNPASPL